MIAKVGHLVIDARDPQLIAPFWCGMLGVSVAMSVGDGEVIVLSPTADGLTVGFQRVAEAKVGKNRIHLDLFVEDLNAATADVVSLGGRWSEPGNTRDLGGFQWRCMSDPEGNEFDLEVLPG